MSIKSNRGATLVELMTSIAIFGIIAAAALGLLLYATNINSDITAEVIETNRVYQALDFVKTNAAESTYLGVSDEATFNTESGVYNWDSVSKTFTYKVDGVEKVEILTNIEAFTITPGTYIPDMGYKYLTLGFTTTEGNSYTITVSCKNG